MSPLIRFARYLFLVAVMAPSAAGASPGSLVQPPTASKETASSEFTSAQIRADFTMLYKRLQDSHYDLFARRSRAEYDALYARMLAGFDQPMALEKVQKQFQHFVAYGNVAHAHIAPPAGEWEQFRAGGGKAFPLFLRVVDGRVYVVDHYSGHSDLKVGDEILSVDGEAALRWFDRLRAQVSADTDYLAYSQMEMQLPMLVWREHGEVDSYDVVLASGAQRRRITLPALSRTDFETHAQQRPEQFALDANAREARLLEGAIAYLRPGPFYDNRPEAVHPWDPAAFKAFINDAFETFLAAGAQRLLIDLRDNPGGDNSFSDPMVAWFADRPFRFSPGFDIRISQAAIDSNQQRLADQGGEPDSTSAQLAAAYEGRPLGSRVEHPIPLVAPRPGQRFKGRVYVLVNRHSYSNAVLVAAIAQDYGFATIVGEETADLASTYGAMEKFRLPHTGIEVGFPKARILRPNGDPRPRGVVPDIAIATPLDMQEKDVVLERALQAIAEDARRRGQ